MKETITIYIYIHICFATASDVLLNLPQGEVQGYHVDYGSDTSQLFYGSADVFLGIPYVQAPVGNLRFQKPQQLLKFPGNVAYNATNYKPACPTNGNQFPQSEDCLYLNVFTPNTNPTAKYPVMVWIHGGAFVSGSAWEYQPEGVIRNLVSRGVIVVTIQYRLGLLGFFTTHSPDFPPNLALLDQVEAIRWVNNNIQYFGGDSYRITLFGQSAGACSVSAHTYSPLSQGLFQQAILESGVASVCFEGGMSFTDHSFRRAQALCNTTRQEWNSNDFTSLRKCMMGLDYSKWLPLDDGSFNEVFGWKMSQDDNFMPGVPRTLAGQRRNIPIMMGSNKNEFSYFLLKMISAKVLSVDTFTRQTFEYAVANLATSFGDQTSTIIKIMENTYAPPDTADSDHMEWLKITDWSMSCGGFTGFIGEEADLWMSTGNDNLYLYEYTHYSNASLVDYSVPGWKPVPHTAELPFIMMPKQLWTSLVARGSVDQVDLQLADWFGETWTNFAKYGFPRRTNEWTPVKLRSELSYLEIGSATYDMRKNYRKTDQIIWNKVIPALIGKLPPLVPDYNNGTNTFTSTTTTV